VGAFRGLLGLLGLQGFEASLVHGAVIWGTATVLLPRIEVAPPAGEWPVKMHMIEGVHHLVYAGAAGIMYDLMNQRPGRQPHEEERRETRFALQQG